jgi:predicted membrane protein
MRMTPEEVEVRVWAFVVVSITVMVLTIGIGLMWLVGFEPQDAELAPIDAVFLEILKAIAFMGVGTLGGIAGRKVISKGVETVYQKGQDDAGNTP